MKKAGLSIDNLLTDLNLTLLVQEFDWTNLSALSMKVLIEGHEVVAIIDTGSSGVVLSEACVSRLNLKPDDEVDFSITSATESVKKKRKIFFSLEVAVGDNSTSLPAIVLEGLHFDVLLGMNWLKSVKGLIDSVDNSISINGMKFKLRSWPEPSSYTVTATCPIRSEEVVIIPACSEVKILVYLNKTLKKEYIYNCTYKNNNCVSGNLLVE